jgi:hypothetical protein
MDEWMNGWMDGWMDDVDDEDAIVALCAHTSQRVHL